MFVCMEHGFTPQEALRIAVARAGGQCGLAKMLKVTQQTISNWIRVQKRLPAEHVLDVEYALGISRYDLRPDIYPREEPLPHRTLDRWVGIDQATARHAA